MYKKRNPEWIRHLDFEVIDVLCIILAYMLSGIYLEYTGDDLLYSVKTIYLGLLLFLHALWLFVTQPYKHVVRRGYWKELVAVSGHFLAITLLAITFFFGFRLLEGMSRLFIILQLIIGVAASWSLHSLYKLYVRKSLQARDAKRMVLISDTEHATDTYRELRKKIYSDYRIIALILVDKEEGGIHFSSEYSDSCEDSMMIIFGAEQGKEYLRTNVVDEVYVDWYMHWKSPKDLIDLMLSMGLVVHIGLAGMNIDYPNRTFTKFGDRMVLTTNINIVPEWQMTMKRMIDILGALVGLMLTGIACLFVVPAIKIADPGPAFFAQERIGKNGRPFRFYKFRSMYMDAEERKAELMAQNEMNGLMFKLENDPRIIGSEKGPGKGIGNFIRRTSLDELPQFWNVLRGDMSLVGTRPPTRGEYDQYDLHHKVRLSMKPGITGLWQVSGRSDITDFEEVVKLDTKYIEDWNLGLDIKILLKTVWVVLTHEGSR